MSISHVLCIEIQGIWTYVSRPDMLPDCKGKVLFFCPLQSAADRARASAVSSVLAGLLRAPHISQHLDRGTLPRNPLPGQHQGKCGTYFGKRGTGESSFSAIPRFYLASLRASSRASYSCCVISWQSSGPGPMPAPGLHIRSSCPSPTVLVSRQSLSPRCVS